MSPEKVKSFLSQKMKAEKEFMALGSTPLEGRAAEHSKSWQFHLMATTQMVNDEWETDCVGEQALVWMLSKTFRSFCLVKLSLVFPKHVVQ